MESGGRLELRSLVISDSIESCAMFIRGEVLLHRTTVKDCSANLNWLGHILDWRGGAIQDVEGGKLIAEQSVMQNNTVQQGKNNLGGVIAMVAATLKVENTTFSDNVAQRSGKQSQGGAIYAYKSML